MAAFKNKTNGTWYVQFRYTDWKGERQQKLKRGFATKKEAQAWEREFLMQKQADVNMTFESFAQLYEKDMKPNAVSSKSGKVFLCQVGTKKFLRIYKPFIGGQPPVNGLRFLYALLPFFVRRFLYAASNASIIGVTGSSLSGLDRYSNRMPFSLNFRSNLMKEEVSRLIREVSRVRIVPMP